MFTKHSKQNELDNSKKSKKDKRKGISPSKEVAEEFVKKTSKTKKSMFMKKKK